MHAMRFVVVLGVLIFCFLMGAGLLNLLIDPYDIFGMPRRPGLNATKPNADAHTSMVKAFQIERVAPRTVLFGTSRVDIGLDPNHPSWPQAAKPVYNYGFPAGSIRMIRQQLQHAAQAGPLHTAMVGLEFHDFLGTHLSPAAEPSETETRLQRLSGALSGLGRSKQQFIDATSATLTLNAVLDSFSTLLQQGQTSPADVNQLGLTSEGSFARFARSDGYNDLFTVTDLSIVKVRDHAARKLSSAPGAGFIELAYLRSIIEFCRDHNIELYLFIPPYHADYLEIADAAGLWKRFEDWKLALVELVEEYEDKPNSKSVVLWDFASYDAMTTEVVPAKGDRRTSMKWFWEPVHFKKDLGDIMLSRMQGDAGPDFGVKLSSQSVAARLASGRAGREKYRATNPGEVERLGALVRRARQSQERGGSKSTAALK